MIFRRLLKEPPQLHDGTELLQPWYPEKRPVYCDPNLSRASELTHRELLAGHPHFSATHKPSVTQARGGAALSVVDLLFIIAVVGGAILFLGFQFFHILFK